MILILLIFSLNAAICEESTEIRILEVLDLSEMVKIGNEHGVDVRSLLKSLLSGGAESLSFDGSEIRSLVLESITANILGTIMALMIPLMMGVLIRILTERSGGGSGVFGLICRVNCIAVICASFLNMIAIADEVIKNACRSTEALTPVLVTAYTLSGQENAGSAVSAISTIASGMIQNVIGRFGRILALAALVAAVAGNLSDKITMKRLHGMICEVFQWFLGLVMSGYIGMLSLRGRLAAIHDSTGVRTARYAIESIIPIIGGNVSDSLGSFLAVAGLIRSALGVIGVILVVSVAVLPVARMAGLLIGLKLAAAVCEPMGDGAMAVMLGQAADAARILLVSCMSVCLICILLSGSCITVLNVAK